MPRSDKLRSDVSVEIAILDFQSHDAVCAVLLASNRIPAVPRTLTRGAAIKVLAYIPLYHSYSVYPLGTHRIMVRQWGWEESVADAQLVR
eukprot:SAG31_NODE_3574_length_4113_cov_2.614848_3_plen_90_part_00